MKLPPSRAEAIARGTKQYDTGQVCRHGHKVPRWTVSGTCVECSKAHSKASKARIREGLR